MAFAKWAILILLVLITGCASVITTIENPQGEIYTIKSKRDALVAFKQTDGTEITLDNRGKLGIVESIFGVLIMKTDVKISNKEGTQ